ncbi:MAG: ShlB/FhaC/HecB family hemolysin secretion/activation protein [Bacteroidota bacterium]|nr:ShlB/FhaC/HecB family hemolysin secretion/activation protein [Bacteroidota bacterium]
MDIRKYKSCILCKPRPEIGAGIKGFSKHCSSPLWSSIVLDFLLICLPGFLTAQVKSIQSNDSSKTIVQKVQDFSEKDNYFSRLLKNIIVHDDEQYQPVSAPIDPDRNLIREYTGKVIRKINIENLDIFGASVNDPDDSLRNWFQKRGNSLHVNTKDWIIKDRLIFSEGQIFIPYYIQESERIIRLNPYIYDVRIVPQKIQNNPDSVDIVVYVQDVWSINGSAAYSKADNSGSVSFNDINFLGYGNEIKGGLKFSNSLTHGWDWDGSYTFNNIQKTFVSAKLYYASDMNRQQYGLMIGRDFFSPIINWAGAVGQDWQNIRYPDLRNKQQQVETVRFNRQDYWLGYAFDIKPFDPTNVNQNRFNIAGRITRTVYSQKPDFDTMNLFQDNTFYLGRIGYSYRTYYQDRFIFGLGRTEDIPLINMIELLFGLEKSTKTNRPYYGLKTGYSFYRDNLGFVYGGFQTGALRSKEKWLSRTSVLEFLYFSKLNTIGTYNWRHYIGARYSYSFDPLRPLDMLNINNEDGLRGFSDGELRGNKKLILNYENDIFVPLKFFGFKLAIITFADFGLISSTNSSLFSTKLFQGYGFGFRIKNEHLIFPPFQFMFAFYPNTPESGGKHFNMFRQSSIYYHFNQFQFSDPSVVSPK